MAKKKKEKKVEDFKKRKSKVGKKLPPADNATNTSFKARSIQLPSQLQPSGEPTNLRNQSLKDLLGQVSHYSSVVRQGALAGLKDLFVQNPHILQNHMGQVLEKTLSKSTDTDAAVRQSCLSLVTFIFKNSPSEHLSPYFPLVVAHLCCAMSHIYDDVQLDSLTFLDLSLEMFPDLVAANASKLLNNFVSLMSHGGSDKSRGVGSVLSVNPKGKLSSASSRLKILQRLKAILKALVSTVKTDKPESGEERTVICANNNLVYVSLVEGHNLSSVTKGFALPGTLSSVGNEESGIFGSIVELRGFIGQVLPLLVDSWVECQPAHVGTELHTIPPQALETLCVIVDIICVLCKNLDQLAVGNEHEAQHITEKFYIEFISRFLVHFPFENNSHYSRGGGKKGLKRQQNKLNCVNSTLLSLNLGLCEIVSSFGAHLMELHKDDRSKWFGKVSEFVQDAISGDDNYPGLSADQLHSLLIVIKRLLMHGKIKHGDHDFQEVLLTAVLQLYERSHLMSTTKARLVDFLSDILLNEQFAKLRDDLKESGCLSSWMSSLPSVLLQLKSSCPALSLQLTGIITRLLIQGYDLQKESLQCMERFFDPGYDLFTSLDEQIQHAAVELIYRLDTVSTKLMEALAACCQHRAVPLKTKLFLLQILNQRSPCSCSSSGASSFSLSLYLRFLLSVLIGYKQEELFQLQTKSAAFPLPFRILSNSSLTPLEVEETQGLMTAVCRCFASAVNTRKVYEPLKSSLSDFLKRNRTLPELVVYRVIYALGLLASSGIQPVSSPLVSSLGQLIACSLVFCCVEEDKDCQPQELRASSSFLECLLQACFDICETVPDLLHDTLESLNKDFVVEAEENRVYSRIILKLLQCSALTAQLRLNKSALEKLKQRALAYERADGQDTLQASLEYEFNMCLNLP